MVVTDFHQRRNRVLEATVELYIATASPVGSEVIARKLRSVVSPATIRHIMAELEAAGYLYQPHTSAGRIPTEKGYRYYVNSLMQVRWLGPEQIRQIEHLIGSDEFELEQLFERTGAALAESTKQAAFVIIPTVKQSRVRQIELVPLSVHKILCVLVGDEEIFASHVVEVEEPLSADEAAALVRFINTELVGLPFCDLLGLLERRMLAERDSFYHFIKRSLDILEHALSTEPNERLLLDGTSYVVAQPEFRRDPKQAHQFLRGLESQKELIEQVRQDLGSERMQVRIGCEVQVPGFEVCSYVTAPFTINEQLIGGVGILGPKRMDYPKMAAWVDGMARSIQEIFRGHANYES